jgi:hypothetical protein
MITPHAVDAPAPPTSITVTPYVDQGTGGVKVTYTPSPSAPIPSFTDVEWGTVDGFGVNRLIHVERVPVGATPPDAVKIAPLTVNQRYFFQLFGVMANGVDRGAGSTPIVVRVGGNSTGGDPPLPVPVTGLWSNPLITDAAGLAGYTSALTGTGAVVASKDYLWNGNASAKFGTAAGTDTATLRKVVESVVPGAPMAWQFRENYASSAHGLWVVQAQEYAIDGTVGLLTTLYSGVPATAAVAGTAHTGPFVPVDPLVALSVTLDANGYASPLTAYMGDVGLLAVPPLVAGADAHYVHTQVGAATTWTVVHNLGKYPAIQIFDSAADEVMGDVHHDSINQATLRFGAAFSGTATCN